MNTEKLMADIQRELKALKDAYSQIALQLPIFTKAVDFVPSKDSHGKVGRVVVTYNTATGMNTLATLETMIDGSFGTDGYHDFKTRRVRYNGGARWYILTSPYDDVQFRFQVQSVVDGSLEAKMIWQ